MMIGNFKYILIAGMALCISIVSQAQTITVTGTVKDAATREPLAFCNVTIAGTTTGTSTDTNGKFSLQIDEHSLNAGTLVFSFVGYVTDSVKLSTNKTQYSIYLKGDLSALQE